MLTRKAPVVLGASVALAVVGVAFHLIGVAIVSVALGLLFAVNGLFAGRPDLDASVTTNSERASEGQAIRVDVKLTNKGRRAALFEHRLDLPSTFEPEGDEGSGRRAILPRTTSEWTLLARPRLLGLHPVGPLRIRIGDPSALRSTDHIVSKPAQLMVFPFVERIRAVPIKLRKQSSFAGVNETPLPGDGFEFFTLRQYRSGDPIRSVNWRASARSSGLIVNQRTRESYMTAAVILDATEQSVRGRLVSSPYAMAARGLAALADFLVQRRDQVQFHYFTDELHTIHPGAAERQRRAILEAMATTRPTGAMTWREVLAHVLPTLRPGAPLILGSSFETDPTIVPIVRELMVREHPIIVLSAASTWPGAPPDPEEAELRRLHRLMVRDEVRSTGALFVDLKADRPFSVSLLEASMQ